MVVETIHLESDRSVTDLASGLELAGGALVVLKWQRGIPTIANVYLPGDDERQAQCRRVIDGWMHDALPTEESVPEWPLGHPRRAFGHVAG